MEDGKHSYFFGSQRPEVTPNSDLAMARFSKYLEPAQNSAIPTEMKNFDFRELKAGILGPPELAQYAVLYTQVIADIKEWDQERIKHLQDLNKAPHFATFKEELVAYRYQTKEELLQFVQRLGPDYVPYVDHIYRLFETENIIDNLVNMLLTNLGFLIKWEEDLKSQLRMVALQLEDIRRYVENYFREQAAKQKEQSTPLPHFSTQN